MSNNQPVDKERRVWMIACGAAGGVAAAATGGAFLTSMAPSERAKAAGAPVELDISGMQPGDMKTVEWRGKPVWVVRRDEAAVEALPELHRRAGCSQLVSWLDVGVALAESSGATALKYFKDRYSNSRHDSNFSGAWHLFCSI